MENIYDLDIALDIIARMQVKKTNELDNTSNELKKLKLKQEADMLWAEERVLYKDTPMQDMVIRKAIDVYAPILKAEHAAN